MNIDRFKHDHTTILAAIADLKQLVKQGIAANANGISEAIIAMSSTIKLHLAAEDRYLYPTLASSSNQDLVGLGQRFQDEMGTIAGVYMGFAGRWNLPAKLLANPEGFRTEANEVIKALHQRIRRENLELYPLIEGA